MSNHDTGARDDGASRTRARILGQQDWPFWRRQALVRARGGLIHPGTLPPLDRETFGSARSLFRAAVTASATAPWADRVDGLSLVFVDHPGANALALEAGARRVVVLQSGLIRRLWAVARLAVGGSRFLEDTFATPPPEAAAGRFLDEATWKALYAAPGGDWPKDRAGFLYELFMYGLDFVVHHELAHHVRGHLDLLTADDGVRGVDEGLALSDAELPEPDRLVQLIELDADINGLDLILHGDVARGLRGWSPDQLTEHAFRLMLAAILVFMVLDVDHRPVSATAPGRHPAPILRAMWMTQTIVTTFAAQKLLNEAEARIEQEDAWAQAAEIAQAMGLPEGRWWGLGDLADFEPYLAAYAEDAIAFSRRLDEANHAGGHGPGA